jgi:hypothetical protein
MECNVKSPQPFGPTDAQVQLHYARWAGTRDAADGRDYSPTAFRIPQLQDAYREAFEAERASQQLTAGVRGGRAA